MSAVLALFAIFIGSIGLGIIGNANNPFSNLGTGDRDSAKRFGKFLLAVSLILLFACVGTPERVDYHEMAKQQFMLR